MGEVTAVPHVELISEILENTLSPIVRSSYFEHPRRRYDTCLDCRSGVSRLRTTAAVDSQLPTVT